MICWKRRNEAKTKHPAVDNALCTNCGKCIDICPQGVYDKARVPRAVVNHPERCAPDCKECADVCPHEAITYFDELGEVITVGCNYCGGCF